MAKKKLTAKVKRSLPGWTWLALAAVVLVALALAVFGSNQTGQKATELPRAISVAQAAELRDQGAFILDVREPSEWQEVHIPDATLIPLGQLAQRLSEVPKDQDIVVVCRSGNRSQQGRDILLQAGFGNVTSMNGGMNDWKAQGLPTASGN